jgi:uncharacterized membrane protein
MSTSEKNNKSKNERTRLLQVENSQTVKKEAGSNDEPVIEEDERERSRGSILVISFLLMLIFQLGNRIFGKLETYPMYNYPLFMNLMSTVLYIPICFAYVIPVATFFPHIISEEQLNIPKYKFLIMGTLDSIAGIMAGLSVNYITNAAIIVLIQQSAIPISMVISKIALSANYSSAQYIGAGVVLVGIVVVLLPSFFSTAPVDDDYATSVQDSGSEEFFWLFILALSCIPMCLSSVYKEFALGETEIDVVYLNGWVATFQAIIAIPLLFPSASAINLPYDQIIPNMYGGLRCWFGINTVTEATATLEVDDCTMAPLYVNLYLFFNVIYNVLIILILKYGSANILWLSSTVIVPLSNVAFSLPFIPRHKPIGATDLAGLLFIMSGLIIYRFLPQMTAFWFKLTEIRTFEEIEAENLAENIATKAEQKQSRYVGLNQIEALQSLVDTRVLKEQKARFRSSQQIRGSFLLRLGIPPSPHIQMTPSARHSSNSPQLGGGSIRRTPKLNEQSANMVNARKKANEFDDNKLVDKEKKRAAEV